MKRTYSFIAPFLYLVLCGGCASSKLAQPKAPDWLADIEPPTATTPAAAPPTVAGDIQFTMTDRQAKSAPVEAVGAATTLQPQKANTSGVTSTGVLVQHVHSSQ